MLQPIPRKTDIFAIIEDGESLEDFAQSLISLVIECRMAIAAAGFDEALEEIGKDPKWAEVSA